MMICSQPPWMRIVQGRNHMHILMILSLSSTTTVEIIIFLLLWKIDCPTKVEFWLWHVFRLACILQKVNNIQQSGKRYNHLKLSSLPYSHNPLFMKFVEIWLRNFILHGIQKMRQSNSLYMPPPKKRGIENFIYMSKFRVLPSVMQPIPLQFCKLL